MTGAVGEGDPATPAQNPFINQELLQADDAVYDRVSRSTPRKKRHSLGKTVASRALHSAIQKKISSSAKKAPAVALQTSTPPPTNPVDAGVQRTPNVPSPVTPQAPVAAAPASEPTVQRTGNASSPPASQGRSPVASPAAPSNPLAAYEAKKAAKKARKKQRREERRRQADN